ncbi:phosphotransferase family protein [Streptomyces hirsutus]|uniref:phosphotransferase family protein n=1 Tax=Streptomyces hirsutus TaxID=35620 RepID=UPI0034297190
MAASEHAGSLEGLDLGRLADFLRGEGVPVAGPLDGRLLSGGKSNLTFSVTDGEHRWVVRRPPVGDILPGAHNMAREHHVMSALAGSAVPVPRTISLCEDPGPIGTQFYVMEQLTGSVVRTRDDAAMLSPDQRRALGHELVDVLASIHNLDYTEVGLGDLGRPSGYLERQLGRWAAQLDRVKTRDHTEVGVITDVLGRTMPQSRSASLVHGDYRLDNVMVSAADPTRIEAVLDWELATLGDPMTDLAALVMFWDEPGTPFNPITRGLMAFEGFPTRAEVIERYASVRGGEVGDLDWYLVFSEFKLAVILEQINARHLRGETRGEGFEGVDEMVVDVFRSARVRIEEVPRLRAAI